MEVEMSSPLSSPVSEDQPVMLPGLDMLTGDKTHDDSPIDGPESSSSSQGSPGPKSPPSDCGPTTPSGDHSRDSPASLLASNEIDEKSFQGDESSQERLRRTPINEVEGGENGDDSNFIESENESSNEIPTHSMIPLMETSVEKNMSMEVSLDNDPSVEVSVESSEGQDLSEEASAELTEEKEQSVEEFSEGKDQLVELAEDKAPSSEENSQSMELSALRDVEDVVVAPTYSANHLPGLDIVGDVSANMDFVPGLDSGHTAPTNSGMYAFLSSAPDDVEEEEEEEEEKDEEEKDEEMEDETTDVQAKDSIPFLGESSSPAIQEASPEHEVEAQVDVVEQVVETSEVPDSIEEHEEQEDKKNETTDVAAPAATDLPANIVETVESETKEMEQAAVPSPSRSPQQVVEEVFLSTKDQDSGESDFEGFEASEAVSKPPPAKKRRARVIDDDEEEEAGEGEESDFEGFEPEENKKGDRQGLIADIFDIFGHSDDEGEFEGFAEAEVQPAGQEASEETKEIAAVVAKSGSEEKEDGEEKPAEEKKKKKKDGDSSSSSSEDEGVSDHPGAIIHASDFEQMMIRKKEENRKRRRRRGDIDIINNSDDLVVQLISEMKMAASHDRELIMQKMPAIQKLRMLPQVVGILRKSDFQMALIDCGVLSAITEWLSPLPDRSLPALPIRRALLQALTQLPGIGADSLKESGVGKAVMYLNKHPKEIPDNKKIAGKLIYNWSRPIFDLTCDYKSLSKEERQKRDMEHLPKKRAISSDADATPKRDIDREMSGDSRPLRPGDPGWVARARVPLPSNKDYVIRPRSKVDSGVEEGASRKLTRFEKHMRKIAVGKNKGKRMEKAVGMSLEGRKMNL